MMKTSLFKFLPQHWVSIAAVLLFYLSLEYEFRLVGCGLNNCQRPCCGDRPTFIRMRYGLCSMFSDFCLSSLLICITVIIGLYIVYNYRFDVYSGY